MDDYNDKEHLEHTSDHSEPAPEGAEQTQTDMAEEKETPSGAPEEKEQNPESFPQPPYPPQGPYPGQADGQAPWQQPYPPQGPYPGQGEGQIPWQQPYPPQPNPYYQMPPQGNYYGQTPPQQAPQQAPPPQQKRPANNMAVTSMILGIISMLSSCCCFPVGFIVGFALGMGGLVLSIMSKKGQPFSPFAIAGLVLSILGIVGSLFIFGCYLLTAHMMQDPEYAALFNEIFQQYQQYYNGN